MQVTQRELPRFLPLARSLSPMRTETSSRMRILRNIHNRHVVRGGRGRGRGRDRDRGHCGHVVLVLLDSCVVLVALKLMLLLLVVVMVVVILCLF